MISLLVSILLFTQVDCKSCLTIICWRQYIFQSSSVALIGSVLRTYLYTQYFLLAIMIQLSPPKTNTIEEMKFVNDAFHSGVLAILIHFGIRNYCTVLHV